MAHYDGDETAEMPWGVATYVEGDITVKEFPSPGERDKETDQIAIFYWRQDDDVPDAPKAITDGRLGPYRQCW